MESIISGVEYSLYSRIILDELCVNVISYFLIKLREIADRLVLASLNCIQDGPFWGWSRMGGVNLPPSLKFVINILQ